MLDLEHDEKFKKMVEEPEDFLEFIGGRMRHIDENRVPSILNHLVAGTSKMNLIFLAHVKLYSL
jgi:hypothetical protein